MKGEILGHINCKTKKKIIPNFSLTVTLFFTLCFCYNFIVVLIVLISFLFFH